MVYLITYELFDKSKDLTKLHKKIKSHGAWWHHIENVWFIETNQSVNEIYNTIIKFFTKKDNVVIIEVGSEFAGWIPESGGKWLNNRTWN